MIMVSSIRICYLLLHRQSTCNCQAGKFHSTFVH